MKAKILVVYHKQADLIKNDVFEPIHVGEMTQSESCKFLVQNMIGDDTGDNISCKNTVYNELTAIYWAWKNYDSLGNPDYIGLTHYRRQFLFTPTEKPYYEIKEINADFYEVINFSNQNLEALLTKGDFIAPMPSKRFSIKDNYKRAHNLEDLLLVENIIKQKYPDYTKATELYLNGSKAYFHNMFVFDKTMFFRYCEWIFDILSEFENITKKPLSRMFVSERLTGIFFTKLEEEGKKAILLPTLFIIGKKANFANAVAETKANLKAQNFNLLYAFKPLIMYFIPSFIMRVRRNRTSK